MKKAIFALMMVAATSTASFAKVNNTQAQAAVKQAQAVVKEVAQAVKDAPSGTTYGVAEANKQRIVLNTPSAASPSTKTTTAPTPAWA